MVALVALEATVNLVALVSLGALADPGDRNNSGGLGEARDQVALWWHWWPQ